MVEPIIELLQATVQHVLEGQTHMLSDRGEVKHRMSTLDMSVAGVKRDIAILSEQLAAASFRSDRFQSRLDRVERRLELSDLS